MVICAARVRWKDLSAIFALTAAFALCLVGGRPQAVAAATTTQLDLEGQLTDYLTQLGWEVTDSPVLEQVLLPETFGPEFDQYLALQQEGGFDLLPYAGATVVRYSYTVTNYPSGESGVWADLLVLDGKIIGGELRSSQLDGFMIPLTARPLE